MSTIFHGTSLSNGHTTKRGFSTTNLRARLASTEAPSVVSQRAYLRANMPSVYQDGDFGLRFLESLEMSLDPIVATLDVLSRYFHSTLAPRDVLGLLASWVGLPVDESWPDDRLREALSRESEISRRRGTKAGLVLALEIAFPQLSLRVEDGGGVRFSSGGALPDRTEPPSFVVYCDEPISQDEAANVARVIESVKPAHVGYRLRIKGPG